MSSMSLTPASTRLLIGQETNRALRSTRVTSSPGAHFLRYLAAVAPPKPPPMTTTRPRASAPFVVAQPAARVVASAAEILRKSRRLMFMDGFPQRSDWAANQLASCFSSASV